MKKLLVFLLISTIAYAAIEELKEYDDVSLEISGKSISTKTTTHTSTSHTSPTKPVHTGTTKPVHTGTTKPVQTGTTKPVHTGTTKPVQTGTTKPGHTDTTKPGHTVTTKPGQTKKPDLTHVKHIIDKLKGVHPFDKIFDRVKELQKHMKKKPLTKKEIQRHFSGKALDIFQKLSKAVQNGIHWLKVNGFWEPLKEVVKTVGKVGATSLCSAYLSPVICGPAVGFVFDAFIDKQIDKL
jgi:hypothetical protein